MRQLRKISLYDRNLKDKYYCGDDGSIYSEVFNNKVMNNGERRTVSTTFIRQCKAKSNKWSIPFKDWGLSCIVLNNGKVLRRLKTTVRKDSNEVQVGLISTQEELITYKIHRLIAEVFLGSIENKEVHHKNGDKTNNSINNLEILKFEEHRGKGNYLKNHSYLLTHCNDYRKL